MTTLNIPRLLIAGTHSGVGKTTITIGLMKALVNRGYQVQGFKSGPDFIDPTFHTAVTKRPSRNLDSWMLDKHTLLEVFQHGMKNADVAVMEGVMGLYDGYSPLSNEGSAADISLLLQTPVILVIDASSMARSAAALVLGFQQLDPHVPIRGVIANRVGGKHHFELLKEAIEATCQVPLLGYYPDEADFQLPERHLGLIPAVERGEFGSLFDRLARQMESTIDLDHLMEIATNSSPMEVMEPRLYKNSHVPKVKIAVAKDQAFNFYYEDNLDLLRNNGAMLEFFSPLEGEPIPDDADGLYIGGGFPEEFAQKLSANETYRRDFRRRIEEGLPAYAECGGYMYLTGAIVTTSHIEYPMTGVIPVQTIMQKKLTRLGYTLVTSLNDHLLLAKGEQARGHEFHYSIMNIDQSAYPFAYTIEAYGQKEYEGYEQPNLLASYVHLHFASHPPIASRFIEICWRYHHGRS